ncbi:hypothetical protein PBRA_001121 [Plasmodiophora brassicae]|uniref:Cation/H+ exchanger transmembrane domain-containing protein n=1 Tax=Plasmodiophora brassicae TaxID=37360 RepID=A0A0G4IVA9_PLABS|nr:hypothetical protein PBRA_001121 [Plasmodiophora brassicae]
MPPTWPVAVVVLVVSGGVAAAAATTTTATNATGAAARVEDTLMRELNETRRQVEVEIEKNAKIAVELDHLRKHVDNDVSDVAVDYDTGMVRVDGEHTLSNESVRMDMKKREMHDPAMLHESPAFIADLVVLLIVATLVAAVAEYYRLPAFLGFIIGGMIVGPSGLSLIHPSNIKFIDSLAQAGVSLLLFESGISFDRPSIQRSYRTAATTFFLQAFTTILLVEVVLSRVISFGESGIRSTLLFTLCMSLSSSSTMGELRGELYAGIDQNAFRTAATILAGQDLIMGLFLCLPEAFHYGALGVFLVMKQLIYGGCLSFASAWFARNVFPRISRPLLDRSSSKLFLLALLSFCVVFSCISTLTGLSIEFGAIIAGITISDSEVGREALRKLRPLTEIFSSILFASIGMLISPKFLLTHMFSILLMLSLVLASKFVSGFSAASLSGHTKRTAITIGVSVSTVAEFSMILAARAYQLSLLSREVYLHILAVTVVSFLAVPVALHHTMAVGRRYSPERRPKPSLPRNDDDIDDRPILIHRV